MSQRGSLIDTRTFWHNRWRPCYRNPCVLFVCTKIFRIHYWNLVNFYHLWYPSWLLIFSMSGQCLLFQGIVVIAHRYLIVWFFAITTKIWKKKNTKIILRNEIRSKIFSKLLNNFLIFVVFELSLKMLKVSEKLLYLL